MSKIRPECIKANPGDYSPKGVTAFLSIYNAVRSERFGLITGKLHDDLGHSCAIGCFFNAVDKGTALPNSIIDEVSTVNDSCKSLTPKQRKTSVMKWLRWKLRSLGYSFHK